MQRVALTLCLGKPADVSLIDEPSSHLDREQRLMVSRVIGRLVSAPSRHLASSTPPANILSLQVYPPRKRRQHLWLVSGERSGRQRHCV